MPTYAKRVIDSIENPRIPLLYPILLFLSSMTLRNFLEFFSDKAQLPFQIFSASEPAFYSVWFSFAISLIHYYIFWIALSLAITIILNALTGEKIINILKTVLSGFFIIIITPAFDLLTTFGAGRHIDYVIPGRFMDLVAIFGYLTPGMILTSTCGLCGIFIYIKTKTKNIAKGIFGCILLYLLLVFLAVLPTVLHTNHPMPIIRALALAIVAEMFFLYYRSNPIQGNALAKDIRIPRLIYYESLIILGIALSRQGIFNSILNNFDSFLLLTVGGGLAWIASVIFNNIEDLKIDRISNANRPLIEGKISNDQYLHIGLVLIILAAMLTLSLNFQTFFLTMLLIGNSLLYSLPPLRLKRVTVLSKLATSLNSLIAVMLGYIFAGGELLDFPEGLTWYFLIFVTLMANFIDLKDYAGDFSAGIRTLPVQLGMKRSKLIIGLAHLVGYPALAFVLVDLRIFLPACVFGLLQFLWCIRKNYNEKFVLITHLAAIISLIVYIGRR